MSWLATGIYLAGVATVFGLRAWLHRRATGDSGHRFSRPRAGGAEWWAQLLFGLALVLGAVAPVLAATGVAGPVWTRPRTQVAGLVVALAGFAAVVAAQHAMGRSWRVGVDPGERTELVTGGVFGLVRNPVFTAMVTASAGLTAMVPSVPQFLALACLVAAVELQVRVVEEPYLRRVHGAGYGDYTRRVGRFVPGVGRRAVMPGG
jgi:protein-S-isoprenylcysteine O-methyltransferase Ste14